MYIHIYIYNVCVVYIYVYIYIYNMCVYIYIYILGLSICFTTAFTRGVQRAPAQNLPAYAILKSISRGKTPCCSPAKSSHGGKKLSRKIFDQRQFPAHTSSKVLSIVPLYGKYNCKLFFFLIFF